MYEKDGEKYFVVDSHMHYWNAAPDNWVPGAEQYAKGWIECFHAYQGLGPKETHWTIEKFMKYSEDDLMKDVFEDGYVDVAVFQPTYLTEWYKEGFNTTERNALAGEKHPGKFVLQHAVGSARGRRRAEAARGERRALRLQGREALHRRVEQRLARLEADRPRGATATSRGCEELGIKNIHVHKGPTIWPLDKDAFDVTDVDHAATDFQDLNFIVEHVGLPRIEDFCFMATQEPNVYAGLSVVIGGLMHARPKFFAKVMGELLFWVGEDKMTFGCDYGIWEPKWQIEGFVDWDYPSDEFSDYPRITTASKKKILGLNAAKLYDIEVPKELQIPDRRAGDAWRRRASGAVGRLADAAHGCAARRVKRVIATEVLGRALEAGRDPELDEPITTLGFVASWSCLAGGRRREYICACRRISARPTSRS